VFRRSKISFYARRDFCARHDISATAGTMLRWTVGNYLLPAKLASEILPL
jgi:hypothetical protein